MGRVENGIIRGDRRSSRQAAMYDDARGGQASLEHRVHMGMLLSEIDTALISSSETERACFILYYGLSVEHGRWQKTRIAAYFGITRDEVTAHLKAAEDKLPSDRHRELARSFFMEY